MSENLSKYSVNIGIPLDKFKYEMVALRISSGKETQVNITTNQKGVEGVSLQVKGTKVSGIEKLNALLPVPVDKNKPLQPISEKNFAEAVNYLTKPSNLLAAGVKAKFIGKEENAGEINRWFRVDSLKVGSAGEINNALDSLSNHNFKTTELRYYDIFLGEKSGFLTRVILNYQDGVQARKVEMEFTKYEK